jgi:hypothetical protein
MNMEIEKPKEGPEHEYKRKIPKRKMEIKTGTTDWQRLNTKGTNNMEGVPGGVGFQRQRCTERHDCWKKNNYI